MRVVAGELGGRPLAGVPGRGTRPTADRVKEAMFSILGGSLDGGWALDAFAGTGALGIEALSRGAERAVFIEKSPAALRVLRGNLKRLGLDARCRVLPMDVRVALHRLNALIPVAGVSGQAMAFRWVFFDPPYKMAGAVDLLGELDRLGLVEAGAVAVVETSAQTAVPDKIGMWIHWKRSTYGDTALTFYRKESTE
ncbi:16S rRNA (guanine(966)-N(2))-methyltransferase RsmD [Kyrpidia tusciae]|uniref:Methyltransferase n=1 Tax=Kyrpidia tusciae (strain DSM 2912 / NBRC 15312 / T2) TaxID=562970 RepID=D5WP88_KYRT2|nr:16S rRNA (guanine(966)-N(2))-methyltransferase RsmD [Kyrpidia tusciae]ADG06147.1 methyltransferase [Kyrpidia tusciae DSM 2912]